MLGQVYEVPDGTRGFDANQMLSAADCAAFVASGYKFARRYIRRDPVNSYDLNPPEVARILAAGLAIAPVQHVERDAAPWWEPTGDKGLSQGIIVVSELARLAFPQGTMVALDLEGVAPGTPSATTLLFCQNWFGVVHRAGYLPELYVGNMPGLSPAQLYRNLSFTRYWRAGSEADVDGPIIRGYCQRQRWATSSDVPPGVHVDFNVDTCRADARGGRSMVFGPLGWLDTPLPGATIQVRG